MSVAAEKRRDTLWFAGTCLLVFALLRLPYFFMSDFRLMNTGTDTIWWADLQYWLFRDGAGFNADMMQRRMNFRLPSDALFQALPVWCARHWHMDLMQASLLLTGAIVLAAIAFTFHLGRKILGSGALAFGMTLAVMLSAYGGWLRYPLLVPKLFAFMLYPLVCLYLLEMLRTNRLSAYIFAVLSIVAVLVLYYVSVAYFIPSLALATIGAGMYLRWQDRVALKSFVIAQAVFWFAMLLAAVATLVLTKGGAGAVTPPALEISRYITTAMNYRLSTFCDDILTNAFPAAFLYLGWQLLKRSETADRAAWAVFWWGAVSFVAMVVISILSHALATTVDALRSTWVWRSAYYVYVPVSVSIFMAIKHMPPTLVLGGKACARRAALPVAAGVFVIAMMYSKTLAYFPSDRWYQFISPGYEHIAKGAEADIGSLVAFTRSLPAGSKVMMPPAHDQNAYTDTFETYAGVPVTYSRKDVEDFLFLTPNTDHMYKAYTGYDAAMAFDNIGQRTAAVRRMRADMGGATHILLRKGDGLKGRRLNLPVVFENDSYMIQKF